MIEGILAFIAIILLVSSILLRMYQFYKRRNVKTKKRKKDLTLLDTVSFSQSFFIMKIEGKLKLKKYKGFTDVNSRLKDTIDIFDELKLNKLQLNELKIELEMMLNDPLIKWIQNGFRIGLSFIFAYVFKVYYLPLETKYDSNIIRNIFLDLKQLFLMNSSLCTVGILFIFLWAIFEIQISKNLNRTKWILGAVNYKLMDK